VVSTIYQCPATKSLYVSVANAQEVNTLSAHATAPATAGTFTVTINGQTTAGIAFDATAATVQTALEALSNVAPGDVTAVATAGANLGVAAAVVTLTWGGALASQDITISINTSGLTGNPHTLATTTAGFAATASRIRPKEAFALDPAVSAQAGAFTAAGFDPSGQPSFGGPALAGANAWIPHNPFKVS